MTRDSSDALHGLIALVRLDGKGELREGMHVERFEAADADSVRELVLTRAMERAAELGEDLDVRTIDVDAVYPLRVSASGGLDQVGDPEPLQPGDTDLAPDTESLHETVSLPRTSMMAALQAEPESAPQPAESKPAVHSDTDLDDEPLLLQEPETADEPHDSASTATAGAHPKDHDSAAPETDEVPIVANMFAEDDEDSGVTVDEYHDEGLDHDFDDLDEDELEAETADATADDEWSPVFARDARAAAAATAQRDQTDANLTAESAQSEFAPSESALAERETVERETAESAPAESEASAPVKPQPASTAQSGASRPAATAGRAGGPAGAPTLDDFFADAQRPRKRVAETGWRAGLRKLTGGLITLPPGRAERTENDDIEAIQRSFDGPRTIVVVNPKGGAHKTTTTLMIAAMFGIYRGGSTLAWDNNETRGTLGWRSRPANHSNTAVDLLRELPKFEISGGASINELDQYVRNQGHARFDVLASDDDAASAAIIDDDAFSRLHRALSRFYRIMVIDTGNNMRASNWEAAVDAADQLVIVSTSREDTAASAAWLADGLRERGLGDKLANAVTIISAPSAKEDSERTSRLASHFSQLTRVVLSVPYDEEFVGGGELDVRSLKPTTRDAWRRVTAEIARGL